jgi:hypothetical protein
MASNKEMAPTQRSTTGARRTSWRRRAAVVEAARERQSQTGPILPSQAPGRVAAHHRWQIIVPRSRRGLATAALGRNRPEPRSTAVRFHQGDRVFPAIPSSGKSPARRE